MAPQAARRSSSETAIHVRSAASDGGAWSFALGEELAELAYVLVAGHDRIIGPDERCRRPFNRHAWDRCR